jgi:hypothetical protein
MKNSLTENTSVRLEHLSTSSTYKLTITYSDLLEQGGDLETVEEEIFLDYQQFEDLKELFVHEDDTRMDDFVRPSRVSQKLIPIPFDSASIYRFIKQPNHVSVTDVKIEQGVAVVVRFSCPALLQCHYVYLEWDVILSWIHQYLDRLTRTGKRQHRRLCKTFFHDTSSLQSYVEYKFDPIKGNEASHFFTDLVLFAVHPTESAEPDFLTLDAES